MTRATPARLVNAAKSPSGPQGRAVVGALVLRKDIVILTAGGTLVKPSEESKRTELKYLSWRSLRAMALRAVNTPSDWRSLMLLTYPPGWPTNGREVKQDLGRFLDSLRWRHPGIRYLWFLEFQRRRAPHFHILTDAALPEPLKMKRRRHHAPAWINVEWDHWLKEAWRKAIQTGHTAAHGKLITGWEIIRDSDGGAKYAVSYAQKPHQKRVPAGYSHVGRFWGSDQQTSRLAVDAVRISVGELARAGVQLSLTAWGDPHKIQFGQAERLREYLATRAHWIDRPASDQFHRRELGKNCPCASCLLEREVSDVARLKDDRTAGLFGP